MKLIEILSSVWAILPEKLVQIENIITSHMAGDKLDLKKIEAKIMSFDAPASKAPYEVVNGSAIIPINGVLSSNPSAFERIFFDAVSMEQIREDVSAAVNDPAVNQVVLSIDSPGGSVQGTQETANHIFNLRGSKPIIAHTSRMMASAAYYIGAAADKILISGDNVMAGSIGTIYRHVDFSKQNENEGVKVTEFVSGQYKNAFSSNAPLDETKSEYIQSIVNKSFDVFAADVTKFRGVQKSNMGEGKVFLGQDAIDAGLVDGFSSLSDIVNGQPAGVQTANRAPIAAQTNEIAGEDNMDIAKLKAEFPDLYASVVAEGKTELEAQVKAASEKALSDERARVSGIKAALIPGHEKLVDALIENGASVEAAMAAIIKAENDKRAGVLASIQASAPAPVAAAVEPAPEPEKEKGFNEMVEAHMADNKSSKAAAISAIAREHPEVHKAYLEQINGGKK
ncbi:MAG: S49 family peptidase [Dehalococcoidia bacterium]|jgi:signal peptide peptidase SppA